LGKVRKKLEKMERKPMEKESTRKEKDNSRNNSGRRRNRIRKIESKGVNRRRRWNGQHG